MERIMQYIWQHRLLKPGTLATVDSRRVEIIDPGQLNTGSGPDFFNAKIRIDGRTWAGDVEIHVRASDWMRHGHNGNKAYDSVILHVVDADDAPVYRSNGELIPQMRLPASPHFADKYAELVNRAERGLPCRETIGSMPPIYLTDWLTALGTERLQLKADRVTSLCSQLGGSWQDALYVTLARALGSGTNAEPMERLALSMPLRYLLKHSDSLTAIEAMLFGQSGLLESAPGDYAEALRREYAFMSAKFGLRKPQNLAFKAGAVRPWSAPCRRVAMLAHYVARIQSLFSGLLEAKDSDAALSLLDVQLTGHWTSHYGFADSAVLKGASTISRSTLSGLLINVVAPVLYAYGNARGKNNLMDKAIDLQVATKAESNSIVTLFCEAGIKCRDSFSSQALIQLRRNYCETRKCLYCRIGHRMLAAHTLRH